MNFFPLAPDQPPSPLTKWPQPDAPGIIEGSGTAGENTLQLPIAPPAAFSSRILMVTSDPARQNLMQATLHDAGYEVNCASDGELAWAALRAVSFDLLITDHDLPALSGLDLLQRVRSSQLNLPVILISDGLSWHLANLPALLPPGATLEKPFTPEALLTAVRMVLPSKAPALAPGEPAVTAPAFPVERLGQSAA